MLRVTTSSTVCFQGSFAQEIKLHLPPPPQFSTPVFNSEPYNARHWGGRSLNFRYTFLSQSAWAAVIKYHRWVSANYRYLFLHFGGWGIQIKMPDENGHQDGTFSLCPYEAEREGTLGSSCLCKDTNPIRGVPTSWRHLNPNFSHGPHLQTPSHCGLGFQHMSWGGGVGTQASSPPHFISDSTPIYLEGF